MRMSSLCHRANEDPNLVTSTYDEANQLTVEENPSACTT